jgi:hypothetical protein
MTQTPITPLNREQLDKLRTVDAPLVFTPRCHPDGNTLTAYIGDGVMTVYCAECGAVVVGFEVAHSAATLLVPKGTLVIGAGGHPVAEAGYSYYGQSALTPELLAQQAAENDRVSQVIDAQLLPEPACPDCGWAMSDHGDPPRCPPVPEAPHEGGTRR